MEEKRRTGSGTKRLRPAVISACTLALAVAPLSAKSEETAETNKLDEIVVTATKTPHTLADVPVETVVVTAEDIAKTNAQNVMDVLKDVPGISVANHDDVFGTYTWRATMHGLSFDGGYGLVLIDGQRVMGCGQSGGMGEYGIGLNQVPVSMVDRVEVVKGPGSALYGSDAMAGVINIITKKIGEEPAGWASVGYGWYDVKKQTATGEVEAEGDRNMAQVSVGYSDKITDKAGYLLSYNYDSGDDISEEPLEADRHSLLAKFDATVMEELDLTSKVEVSDYEKTDNRDEQSYRLSLGGDYKLADDHLISFKGYTYLWDFTHGTVGGAYGYKNGDVGYNQAEAQYTWFTNDINTLTGGAEFQEQGIDYTILNADNTLITVDEDVRTTSLYLQDELKLFDRLTLVGGGRYDDHSVFGDEVNPKFSAMLQITDTTTLRGSVGRSFKSPTIRQLYYDIPYRHGDFYAQSNPDLQPETAMGYTANIEQWLWDNRISLSAGYFRNDVDDMVVRVDTGETYDGLDLVRYENVDEAWTQGVEFMASVDLMEGLDIAVSYTYTDTENEETGYELTYIPTHSLTVRPSYEYRPWGLGGSAGISYTGEQYTDSANTTKIDGYTEVGLKIYKHLSDMAKLSFEVDDLFDEKNNSEDRYYAGRTMLVKFDLTF